MTTDIKIQEFRNHLINLTKEGNPKIMGTPFCILEILRGENSKPFLGKIGKNKFRITLNRPLFPTPYLLEGNFKVTKNKIDYKIIPIWFGYLWIRIIPLFILIFFLVFCINSDVNGLNINWIGMALLFLFFSIILYLPVVVTTGLKRKMEKKFIKEFEITATNDKL